MPLLAILYARTSTNDPARARIPEQLRACREKAATLAAGEPLTVREYHDEGASGDIPPLDRPGYAEALQTAREQKAAFFICLDPDRFSRDVYQALGAADEVDRTGARLQFCLHEYDMSPEGRLFFTLRIAIAEYEKHKIKERTERGRRAKLARGGIPYPAAPYGYQWDADADRPVVADAEAHWVRLMFRWCADEYIGPLQIAERLNSLAVPTRKGQPWQHGTINKILRYSTYRGELILNRTNQQGRKKNRYLPPGQRVGIRPRPESEWTIIPCDRIIDDDTWWRAQSVLAGRRRGPNCTIYLLTGVAICGVCGKHCLGHRNAHHRYYVCSGRRKFYDYNQNGGAVCGLPHLRTDGIEPTVRERVRAWILDPVAHAEARRRGHHSNGQAEDAARIATALIELEAEWDRRVDAYQSGLVRDRDKARAQIEQIKRRTDALRRQREALTRATAQPPVPAVPPEMAERVDRMDAEEWRQAVRLLVRRVVLMPDGTLDIQAR